MDFRYSLKNKAKVLPAITDKLLTLTKVVRMRNNKGFGLIGLLVMIAIMGIIVSGLTNMAAYSIRVSTTARIDSDIMAYVSTLRARLEATGELPAADSVVGQGWTVKRIAAITTVLNGQTAVSYRVTFIRNPGSIVGPSVVSRDIGTHLVPLPVVVVQPPVIVVSKQDNDDDKGHNDKKDNDGDCDYK